MSTKLQTHQHGVPQIVPETKAAATRPARKFIDWFSHTPSQVKEVDTKQVDERVTSSSHTAKKVIHVL